jgi:hypothetical protein
MSGLTYPFTLWVRVTDPERLLEAALAHPDAIEAGHTRDDYLSEEGEIKVPECLVMLFDPGVSPPGCEILDSGVSGEVV